MSADLQRQVLTHYAAIVQTATLTCPQRWAAVELTMPQLKVLLVLGYLGEARVGAVAEALDMPHPSTATGILDRLVDQGYVVRGTDPKDRRQVICRLTSRGAALVRELLVAGEAPLAASLARMAEADLRAVAQGLLALHRAMEASRPVEP